MTLRLCELQCDVGVLISSILRVKPRNPAASAGGLLLGIWQSHQKFAATFCDIIPSEGSGEKVLSYANGSALDIGYGACHLDLVLDRADRSPPGARSHAGELLEQLTAPVAEVTIDPRFTELNY